MADQLEAPPLTAGVDEESKMNVPYILANGEPNMEHPVHAWRASLPEGEPFTTELASAVLSKPKVKVTIGLPHQDSGLPVNALAGMMGCVMAGLEPEDSDERLLTVPKIFEGELPTLDAIESAYRYDFSEDRVAEHVAHWKALFEAVEGARVRAFVSDPFAILTPQDHQEINSMSNDELEALMSMSLNQLAPRE